MTARTHAFAGVIATGVYRMVCGQTGPRATSELTNVDCRTCLRIIRRAAEERDADPIPADHKTRDDRWFLDATREPLPQGAMTRSTAKLWQHVIGLVAGAIGDEAQTIDRSRPERTTPFDSVRHALATMVQVGVHGYDPKSMSDPIRLKRIASGLYQGSGATPDDRAARLANDLHHVRQAFAMAYESDWDPPRVPLETCQRILLLRVVARKNAAEVGEIVGGLDEPIAAKLVGRIARWGAQNAYEHLRSRELVPEAREEPEPRRTATMPEVNGYTLRGWKAIAGYIGVDAESTAKRYEARGSDENPLPVERFSGGVRANPDDLEAWMREEAARNRRRKTG